MGSALEDLQDYLDRSPSPWHAVESATRRLDAAGFVRLDERAPWDEPVEAGYVVRGGALVGWRAADALPDAIRMVGAHTDSPGLRVKPTPDLVRDGYHQLAVEVYGGILNNTWLDRDLGVAGIVVAADGSAVSFDSERPVARVPQLAVHLDREVNDRGLALNRQQHLTPVWGVDAGTVGDFAGWLEESAGIDKAVAWELCLYDVQPSAVLGRDGSMLASGRLDNQVSCWGATSALIGEAAESASDDGSSHASVIALFDHEEVGSASTTGAGGPLLESVLRRLVAVRGGTTDDVHRIGAASTCVSADGAHAVHPNYPERHDQSHRPHLNAGPVIKVNANQRYATSAETAALFQRACVAAGCEWQTFVSRNDMPCGSTIGPISSTRLGMGTVDVGVPQLSMHSAREVCGTRDPEALRDALGAYFAGA